MVEPDDPEALMAAPQPGALLVVLVDDLELARRRAHVALEEDAGVEVVAAVGTLAAGIEAVAAWRPTVAVVALALDDEPDPGVVAALRAAGATRVVVLATAEDDHLLGPLLAAGVDGIVAREGPVGSVLGAVRAAAAGGAHLTPVAAGALLDLVPVGAADGVRRPLALLASGLDVEAVAHDAGCRPEELARRLGDAVRSLAP